MNKTRQLLELIEELVAMEGSSWREKRQALLAEADTTETTAIEEFASWFEKEGER